MPLPEIIDLHQGGLLEEEIRSYVHSQIRSLKTAHEDLHENKVAKWRALYRGQPEEPDRSFPWPNASNIVIQLIATYVDMLRARILGSLFEVLPLFVVDLVGDWSDSEFGGEQKEAISDFLNVYGLEPRHLDLYRVESQAFDECIKLGTVFLKIPWETEIETQVAGYSQGKLITRPFVKYDGPRPEKLRFENFLVTPTAPTLERAKFKCHIKPLTKQDLEERAFTGVYKKAVIDEILKTPDRYGASDNVKKEQQDKNIQSGNTDDEPEWDVYECWFPYFHAGQTYRIIYTYHYGTEKCLRAIYNFYPENEEPFEMGRLGWTDDSIYGYGFCEMLSHYQDEVSTMHNQAIDNATLLNTSVLRVGRNSKLDSNFSLFPMAILPGEEGEIEKIQLGSAADQNVNLQQLTLDLARVRAGVDPGIQAQGGGTTNPKKGQYSAMGTFSVLQEGNRRVNINITDMRYLHLRAGRKMLREYAEFGVRPEYLEPFGRRAQFIKMALQNIKRGRLNLPIRAATASINKELEKQNDMLLTQLNQRHQQGVAGVFQAINNPMIPDIMRAYLLATLKSSFTLMSRIFRNFGHDDISALLPEIDLMKKGATGGQPSQGATGPTNSGTSVVPFGSPTQGAPAPIPTNGGMGAGSQTLANAGAGKVI